MIGKDEDLTGEDEPGKLFVGGLSWETTEDKLTSYFGQFGEIVDSIVMKNSDTGQSRGFGFVTFAEPESVKTVLKKGPHLIDGRAVDPKPCNTKAALRTKRNSQYPKVFLGGLPFDVTETDLRTIFGKFGKVMDVIIMYDHEKNKCRGFGFLSFEDDNGVNKCVADHFVFVNGKKVEVKRAEPRDGRGGNSASTLQWGPQNGIPDPSAMAASGMAGYQGWGGASSGYGYGTPTGGPVSYPGWGVPSSQWGPGYPQQGYGPYGPQMGGTPYGGWNWGMPPQGSLPGQQPPVPQTGGSHGGSVTSPNVSDSYGRGGMSSQSGASSKQDFSSGFGGAYPGYSADSNYNSAAMRSSAYGTGDPSGTGSPAFSGGPGPQRSSSQNQQGYHPYRRV